MKRGKLRLGATDVCLLCELLRGEAFFSLLRGRHGRTFVAKILLPWAQLAFCMGSTLQRFTRWFPSTHIVWKEHRERGSPTLKLQELGLHWIGDESALPRGDSVGAMTTASVSPTRP